MAKTLWNIDFSTLNVTNEHCNGWPSKITHTDNLTDEVYTADGQGTTPAFAVNAVDIDWNGVRWNTVTNVSTPTTINTTGDLLKAIKYAANQGSQYVHDKFTPHNLGLYKVQVNEEGHISNAVAVQKSDLIDLVYDLIQEGNHIEKTKTSDGIKIDCTIDVEPLPLPSLSVQPPTEYYINNGETKSLTVFSNVPGTLILETSEGSGWTASTPEQFGSTHTIYVTNVETIISSSTLNAGDIRVKFVPQNGLGYETLYHYPIFDFDLYLNAGAPVTPTFSISNPSSTTLAKGESATITITTSGINNEDVFGYLHVLTTHPCCTITSSSETVASSTHTITIKNSTDTIDGGTLSSISCSWTPRDSDTYVFVRQLSVLNDDITLLEGEKATPWFKIGNTPFTIEYGQSATIGIESSHLGWITLRTNGNDDWNARTSTDSPTSTPSKYHTITIRNTNTKSDAVHITPYELMGSFNPQDTKNVKSATLANLLEHNITIEPATTTTQYFSVGTTAVTASNYTTANNATTAIPTTTTYTATVRGYGYILAPSDKTVSVVDDADDVPCPITEQTNISIPGHKVYITDGAFGIGGTIRITLS